MSDSPVLTSEGLDDFGDEWEPAREALLIAKRYLLDRPEQGEWDYEDHWEGIAGGILYALHKAGWDFSTLATLPGDPKRWEPATPFFEDDAPGDKELREAREEIERIREGVAAVAADMTDMAMKLYRRRLSNIIGVPCCVFCGDPWPCTYSDLEHHSAALGSALRDAEDQK